MNNLINNNYLTILHTEYDDYDTTRCHDGGSYYQSRTILVGKGCVIYIDDRSCGDFGSDIDVTIISTAVYIAKYGTLDTSSEYTTIPYYYADICDEIYDLTGYRIPVLRKGKFAQIEAVYNINNIEYCFELDRVD